MDRSTLVLRAPSANRVYAQAAGALALAEARWVLGAHLGDAVSVRQRRVGDLETLEVRTEQRDDGRQELLGRLLSTLSTTLGALRIVEDEDRHTLPHDEAAAVLAEAGLRVVSRDGAFRHRVDQSIDRDVLLAVPSDHPRVEEHLRLGTDPVKDQS